VVTVEFTIGVDGSVKDPKIVKANPPKIFDKAVLKAITRWKFNPDMVNGKPVEKRARQDVKFKLQR
jgi:protein TonB